MASFIVNPSKPTRPSRTGKKNSDGCKPALSKGYTRLFQPVRISAYFGRVQTLTQQRLHPSGNTGRLTDVCRFWAA
jgi:hypothetical protein